MKDLEQQQKKIKKVKADIGEIKASKAGEPDANTQNNMDKMKARVKAEVRGTWTGAAVELSNTKRELLKVMDDQGRQLNEQNERLDSLESHIAEQTSVTDRHERAILDHGDISVQQVHSVSIIERSVTSILDRQENRLSSVEMRLADQANQHAQYQTPTSPRNWFPKHSKANEASELRGIIASQGGALRVQGKQLGEMSKEIASLRELCKDLAERVKQTCNKPEITGFHGYTREVARLKEIRQLLPAMSGVQPSGEEPVGSGHAVSQVKDFKPTSLEDVSAEIANYKHFRMTLTPVLARQAWEEAAEE
ncbi:hypothetical protein DL546_004427 [Coniochaeta pulveracea]|uniref:Uncharacterized protein n=1 Tax=Coniochaeta pulveracea TaxID=177199 RepID=A0A420Y1Q6_9PEZI|nr:hypothetical protein DL546_004427 [Coniochaeta pulveracea]